MFWLYAHNAFVKWVPPTVSLVATMVLLTYPVWLIIRFMNPQGKTGLVKMYLKVFFKHCQDSFKYWYGFSIQIPCNKFEFIEFIYSKSFKKWGSKTIQWIHQDKSWFLLNRHGGQKWMITWPNDHMILDTFSNSLKIISSKALMVSSIPSLKLIQQRMNSGLTQDLKQPTKHYIYHSQERAVVQYSYNWEDQKCNNYNKSLVCTFTPKSF